MSDLVHDLMLVSPEFRAWWSDYEVLNSPEEHKAIVHPHAGALLFDRLAFQVFDVPDLTVTVYLASDKTDTAQKLAQILDQPTVERPW